MIDLSERLIRGKQEARLFLVILILLTCAFDPGITFRRNVAEADLLAHQLLGTVRAYLKDSDCGRFVAFRAIGSWLGNMALISGKERVQ